MLGWRLAQVVGCTKERRQAFSVFCASIPHLIEHLVEVLLGIRKGFRFLERHTR